MTAPSTQRLARLLALVPWLSRNEGVTVTEAAEHFGVTPEDLEKDLWLVICCGLPGHGPDQLIDIQFWDDDGHIHVIDPQTLVAPTRFSSEEAAALQVGLTLLRAVAVEADVPLIESTMAALSETTFQDHHGGTTLTDVGGVRTNLGFDPGIKEVIAEAIAGRTPVIIDYYGVTRDEMSERMIWPQDIIVGGSVAYVNAWCANAGADRTFRADRIHSARLPDSPPADGPPETSTRSPSSHTPAHHDRSELGEMTRVSVRVHPHSRWVLDTYDFTVLDADGGPVGASEAHGEAQGETHWLVATIGVWDPRWIVRLALSLGGDLVVTGPPAIRAAVAQAARSGLSR